MHFCVSDRVSEWLSQIVLDKVHLRWEIEESQPPGGDPLQRSAAVIGWYYAAVALETKYNDFGTH